MSEHDEVTISVAEVMDAIDRAASRFPSRFKDRMRDAVLEELLHPLNARLWRLSVQIETTKRIMGVMGLPVPTVAEDASVPTGDDDTRVGT